MSSEPVLNVAGLSKCYRIYSSPRDRLKQAILPRLHRWASPVLRPFMASGPPHYFREFWALQDVSFEVRAGETIGIVGRNGAGKSTLLQMICGIVTPTSGEVRARGRIAALLELGAGFNPEFTGRENVYMNASLLGMGREEIDRQFPAIAAFAEIGDFIDQPVKTYSTGMFVRLAFSIIAHVDADILVIDEALAVGDAFFTQKCMRFLREFQKRGTILFVSHDTGAVVSLCRRAVWLEGGRLRRIGPAKEVCEEYLEAIFQAQQGKSIVAGIRKKASLQTRGTVDQRLRFINASPYRNDVEIFNFRPDDRAFGRGGAVIIDVSLLAEDGGLLTWVVGGEEVCLSIRVEARHDLPRPIVGFYLKDRLGQYLFGDNTFLAQAGEPVPARAGEVLEARFYFRMPVLPVGDYTICAAVAEGTQEQHVQHQWIHDALLLKSHASSVISGLVGIPMGQITLENLSFSEAAESC